VNTLKRNLLAAALLFALAPALLAADTEGVQVPIPQKHRVFNYTGVQCVWASLETLARYHAIPAAKRLTRDHGGPATPEDIQAALNALDVKYILVTPGGRRRTDILKEECAKGWGAGVVLVPAIGPEGRERGPHMITCVHYKDGMVKVIDNLDEELRIQTWTEEEFLGLWDGWMVVLYK